MMFQSLPAYDSWVGSVRDKATLAKISVRLLRLQLGNPGDHRFLGDGVSELKIDYGPGYRIYFARRGDVLILLLGGGDKSTQANDIKKAKASLKGWIDASQS